MVAETSPSSVAPRCSAVGLMARGAPESPARERHVADARAGVFALVRGRGPTGADRAAAEVVDRLERVMRAPQARGVAATRADLRDALVQADRDVWVLGRAPGMRGVGVSAAALVVGRRHAALGWVGDVRIYRWRRDQPLETLGPDGVEARPSVAAIGEPSAAATLGRVFAVPGLAQVPFRDGDVFLLLSPGLAEVLDATSVELLLHHCGAEDLALCGQALLEESLWRGCVDDATVVLARPEPC